LHSSIALSSLALALSTACRTDAPPLPLRPYPTSLPAAESKPASAPAVDFRQVPLDDPEAGLGYGEPEERVSRDLPLADPKTYWSPQAWNIVMPPGQQIVFENDTAEALEQAAREMPPDMGFYIVAGYRTLDEQNALIKQSCENPPGYKTCSPRLGYAPACMPRSGDRHTCSHTTGHAVDLFAIRRVGDKWLQCVTQQQCLTGSFDLESSVAACIAAPCESLAIEAMRENGFCRQQLQPWHFEKPQLSAACLP
jgi:D-alanyl-D-alanine dipeptidase